jgi:hypothetical protein
MNRIFRAAHTAQRNKRHGQKSRLFRCAVCAARKISAALALVFLAALSLYHLVSLSPCHGEEEEGMPMFRRLLLPPERLPEELQRVRDGVLVRLPIAEFDSLVERAAQAGRRKPPPRLLEARYHAALKEESLIGEGQWKLVHTGPGPGLLDLQPFNLALRQARFENGDALIAAFDGKTPALLVEAPGERTVSLDWSARAESGRDGLQFHLEMPPCPVALLELDVPAGRAVTVLNDGSLLSGPHESETADFRRWKIVCGGRQRGDRQRLDIRIHPADRLDAGADLPVPFVHQKTTQKLHPEGLDAAFELTLDGLSRGIRELICECDAELRPRDVVGPAVDGYSFQPGDGNKPARLTIKLREPVRAGTWQILCLAPLHSGPPVSGGTGVSAVSKRAQSIAWRSPGLRLVHGVPRGETLTLWLHPDLRVEGWDAGSFRLHSVDLDRATGAQVLTLSGGALSPLRRPAVRLQAFGVDFSTHQLTWWRCDAGGMALTVQIGWEVSQGQLFQLPVRLPAGWNVEKVEMSPAALLRDWHLRKAAGNTTLFINLTSPLEPPLRGKSEARNPKSEIGSSVSDLPRRLPTLTVYLRPTGSGPFTEKRFAFPDAAPVGARFREGALALDCDEQLFHLQVQTTAERTEPESEGPWGQKLPEYYYRYRGQPVTGEIRLRARPPRLRAKCNSEVLVAGGEAIIETHLLLEAESGSPNTIELSLSVGDGAAWQWRTETPSLSDESAVNRIRRVERVYSNETSSLLHLLAASHPLQAAVVHAARPTGERWRLLLSRPLRWHEPLHLHTRRRLQPHDNRWDVPLPIVLDAEHMEGEVVLHLAGTGLVLVHGVGLRELTSATERGASPWRTFRYEQGEVRLTLAGEARGSDRRSETSSLSGRNGVAPLGGSVENARLVTYAGANGLLRHHFSFQVANWGEHTLLLRLPPGSRPLAVQIDGRWLPHLIPNLQEKTENAGGPIELALPVPIRPDAGPDASSRYFEVFYTRIVPAGTFWQVLDAPVPQLPIAPLTFRRIWRLATQLTPLQQGHYQSPLNITGAVELAALPRHAAELLHLSGSWARFNLLREDQPTDAPPALRQDARELRDQHADQKSSYLDYKDGQWIEWTPIAGVTEERMIVVRRDGVTALGWALGLLAGLSYWLLRRRTERRLILLLPALALFGLGALWLPTALCDLAWWPLLVSGAAAVLEYLHVLVHKPIRLQSTLPKSKNAAPSVVVTGTVILVILGWNGRAAAPAPATVYLVAAPADAPDKQTVLAPADLLDRLKTLARPAPLAPGGPQTVLLDASYEGQLIDEGKQAEFTAVFSAHSLSDGPSTVLVPLTGVGLVGEVLLDGARVAPLAAPQAGYSLPVRGRGRHKIELRFRVPVVGTDTDRNVLFTAPPLVRSRLNWRVPNGAVEPHVLVKNGAQWLTHASDGQHLEADLGSPPLPVHLHWYQPGRPMRVSYQAAYVWDLGHEVNHLTAWLRYRVEQGAIKTLEVDLPAGLEVSSANAQRTVSLTRPSWRARFQLRDWHVTGVGNQRVLHLELPYPISGDFQVTLELLPHAPLTSPAALPLPSPRGIRASGPHYLAYRTQPGLNAQRETSQNLTRIDNKEFAPNWLGGPSLETNFQGIAYRIPPDRPPQLFLRLEPRPPMLQGEVDITIRTGMQRAEVEVVAEVTTPHKDLAAIEWQLPPRYVLASASGEEVRTWTQNGPHLLVWLNRTTAKTRIHLSGWLPLSPRDGHPHLELNGPRLLYADKQHTRLHLAAASDLVLVAVRTRNLQPVQSEIRNPKPETRKENITDFETQNLSYNLACQVQSAANAVARVLTLAEVVERELRFTTTVDYLVTHGELRRVRLRLRNWEEEKVEVQAEHLALLPAPRWSTGERSWSLPLQAGVRGHYQVTLRGRMPLDKAAAGVPMPEVLVQGVERAEYFAAVVGGKLTGQAKGSLRTLKSPRQALQATWPEAAQQLERSNGQAWRIGEEEWQVRLLPQARELKPNPIRIYLQEQWAIVGDGRRWLHEAHYWLRHEAHADLTFDFAAPARVLAAAIDGADVTPLQSDPTRVWVPLPAQAGVRCVRLRWLYDPPEPLVLPNLTAPQLAGAVKGPTLWTVMVPPGWQTSFTGASGWQGAAREAMLALGRADAQLRISQDLTKERRDNALSSALAVALQRFALFGRHAQKALDRDIEEGPQRQHLVEWLKDLQTRGRLLKAEIRNPKSEADNGGADSGCRIAAFEKSVDVPVSWQELPGAEPLTLQLISQQSRQLRQTIIASAQWLGVLAVVWILSLLPFLSARLHLFWPEQMALLGAVGWCLAGLTSIVLALLLAAVCSRIFLVIRGLRVLVRKRRRQPSTMMADNGGPG